MAQDPIDINERIEHLIEGEPPPGAKGVFQFPAPGPCPNPAAAEAYAAALAAVEPGWIIRNSFGFFRRQAGNISLPNWASMLFGPKPSWYFGRPFTETVFALTWFLDSVLAPFAGSSCSVKKLIPLNVQRGVKSAVNKWIGIDIELAASPTDQIANYLCPTVISSVGAVTRLWVADKIDDEQASQRMRFHGLCDQAINHEQQAAGWTISVGDVAALWHRNVIKEPDLDKWAWRSAGVLRDAERKQLTEINRYRHPASTIVDLYYRGEIKTVDDAHTRLAESGITDGRERDELLERLRPLWGLSTIYRAMHLLRPGRVSSALEYTDADAAKDIEALGYTHRQVYQLMVLARTDIGMRQALGPYNQGKISDDQLVEVMHDDGYDDETIALLSDFWRFSRQQKFAADTGAPASKELVADLAAGNLNEREFGDHMAEQGYSPPVIAAGLAEAAARRVRDIRAAGIAAVQADLKGGMVDDQTAIGLLASFGVSADAAAVIVREWQLDFAARAKPVGMAQLCQWFGQGWITYQEYVIRLRAMGYRKIDISRIVDACELAERRKRDVKKKSVATSTSAEIKARIAAAKALGREAKSMAAPLAKMTKDGSDTPLSAASFAALKADELAKTNPVPPTPPEAPPPEEPPPEELPPEEQPAEEIPPEST